MANFDFGLIMMVSGMGATLVVLYLITWLIKALDKLFPFKEEKKEESS